MSNFKEKRIAAPEQISPMDQLAKSLDDLHNNIYPCFNGVPASCMPDVPNSLKLDTNTVYRVNAVGYFYLTGTSAEKVSKLGSMVAMSGDHNLLDATASFAVAGLPGASVNLSPLGLAVGCGQQVNDSNNKKKYDAGKWKLEYMRGTDGTTIVAPGISFANKIYPNYSDDHAAILSSGARVDNQPWASDDDAANWPICIDLREPVNGIPSLAASYFTTSNDANGSGHSNNMVPIIPGVGTIKGNIVQGLTEYMPYNDNADLYTVSSYGGSGTYITIKSADTNNSGSFWFTPSLLPKKSVDGRISGINGIVHPVTRIREILSSISFNKQSETSEDPIDTLCLQEGTLGVLQPDGKVKDVKHKKFGVLKYNQGLYPDAWNGLEMISYDMYVTYANSSASDSNILAVFIGQGRAIEASESIGHYNPFHVTLHSGLLAMYSNGLKPDTEKGYAVHNMNTITDLFAGNYVLVPTVDGVNALA